MVLMSMAVGSEVISSIHLVTLIYLLHIHIHNPISHSHFSSSNHVHDRHSCDLCIVPESLFASYTESIIYSLLVLASYSWCWWTTAQGINDFRVSGYSKCVTIMGDWNADLTSYYQMIVFVASNSLLCWSKRCRGYDNGCRSWHISLLWRTLYP